MSISALFTSLQQSARRSANTPHSITLSGGTRMTVRVRADGKTTLTIARKKKHVSDTEIETFKRECGVPHDAQRKPEVGQNHMIHLGETWWFVSFSW
jgi:hypothetical protein